MLTKLKQNPVLQSGEIQAGGIYPLAFVLLEEGLTLITKNSLFRFLEIEQNGVFPDTLLLPSKFCFFYDDMGEDQLGILSLQVPAFCINIIEHSAQTGEFKDVSLNAMMLLMFFSSLGLNAQVCKATMLNKPHEAVIVPLQGATG